MREKNTNVTQNMQILDQNTRCMQEHYECQDEHQEHFECQDEHQELIFEKFSRKENMQDTKLRNLSCLDTMNAKMHMKNKKRCKTRKHQDQTRRLTKNNLKIMKNTMNA